MAKPRTRQFLIFLRIAVVTAGLIWVSFWISRGNRWQNFTTVFKQLNPAVFILALAMFCISQFIVALRWRILLKTQNVFIPALTAIKLHYLGLFYNNFLPGAVGGDLIRAWYVTKHTDKGFEAALSVFVDRALGFAAMIFLGSVAWLAFIKTALVFDFSANQTSALAKYKTHTLTTLMVLAAVFILALFIPKTRSIMQKIAARLKELALRTARKTRAAAIMYCSKPATVLIVFCATLVSQSLVIIAFWLVGKNLDLPAPLRYYFVFFPVSWVVGALPVSIGGAVLVEGPLVWLFAQYTPVTAAQALVLALVQRLIWMIASIPGSAIHIAGAHLPKDFSVD